jgi:hypothetical protein
LRRSETVFVTSVKSRWRRRVGLETALARGDSGPQAA